ncbi:MAG: NAD-dependent epimerase/dehydratase family protein, partial [Elusimicrobia bacterium]|nr:NAD-dependent epimerase/dehydratase family protein [Elusimicrobiota bacterium]
KKGEKVRVFDNFSTGSEAKMKSFRSRIQLVRGDLRRPADCDRAVKGATYVLHQAAIRSVPKSVDNPTASHDSNATGTLNLLIAARKAKVQRVVYAGTSSAYGDGKVFPQHEDLKPRPLSPYAASKLCGEHYTLLWAKTMGLPGLALRYFNVFGPRQDPESLYSAVIPKFMEQAFRGEPLEVHWDGRQQRDFTHISNVVQANILAARSRDGVGETFNVANGKTYSLLDLIAVIEKLVGRKLERRHNPPRKGDVRKTYADISKAKRVLGYRPVMNFEKGLADTYRYFEENYFRKRARA